MPILNIVIKHFLLGRSIEIHFHRSQMIPRFKGTYTSSLLAQALCL